MKKAEYKRQRNRVRALANKWTHHLGMDWWHKFEIVYYARRKDVPKEHRKEGLWKAVMWTSVRWEYSDAAIHVNVPEVARQGDNDLEYIFLHECMHLFVNQCRPVEGVDAYELKNEEFVCTRLAQAFLWWTAHLEREAKQET